MDKELSLLDQVYELDPLLGTKVRAELERLRNRIADMEVYCALEKERSLREKWGPNGEA